MQENFSEVKLTRTGSAFTSWGLTWFWSACVAALTLSAPVGCYIGSRCAKKFGRKRTIMVNSTLLVVSGILQSSSRTGKSYEMFFLGRLTIGLQIGIGSTAATMYISEVSPISYRGSFCALFAWFDTFGSVAAAVLGFETVFGNHTYWPYLFSVLILCALIQLTVLNFCPESPRFLLIDKEDREAASIALVKLRGNQYNNQEEIQQMSQEFEATNNFPEVSFYDYFKHPHLRKPLTLALIAVCSIQFSGLSAINMFSEPIFAAVLSSYGVEKSSDVSKYLVALLTSTRLIVALFTVTLVDKIGRRKCVLFSLAGLFICNISLAFLLSDIPTTGQLCRGISVGKTGNIMTLFFIFAHSVSQSSGVSSTAFIIVPELFRTNARPKATFMALSIYWTAFFIISMGFEVVEKAICGWIFLIFATLLLIFFLYLYLKLPVLDGKSTNEIASYFENDHHSRMSKNAISSEAEEIQDSHGWSPLLR